MTKHRLPPITDEEEARIQAGIAADPDAREMTDGELSRLRPARDVLPASFFEGIEKARRGPGRPKLDAPKEPLTLRLDPDVIKAFKGRGGDWRLQMSEALRKAAGL